MLSNPTLCGQERFPRGLTFEEFVAVIMTDAPRNIKLRDVVSLAAFMGKGLLQGVGRGKLKAAVGTAVGGPSDTAQQS